MNPAVGKGVGNDANLENISHDASDNVGLTSPNTDYREKNGEIIIDTGVNYYRGHVDANVSGGNGRLGNDNDNEDVAINLGCGDEVLGTDPLTVLRSIKMKYVDNIVIASLNVNSIRNKFDQLSSVIRGNVDLLVVNETKIGQFVFRAPNLQWRGTLPRG